MIKILVVDDERSIRSSLRDILEYEKYNVEEAINGIDAISLVKKKKFDVIFCDIKMPKMDGIEALEKIKEISECPVIMISGHGNIDTAVEAIKKGAFDYIEKPLDLNRLLITVRNALDQSSLITETKVLKKKVGINWEMIGESKSLDKIKNLINKVAPTDARVLITGSNGTGKELVARSIHKKSHRADGVFIEVNCAAIPSELIESQLFGHEKGSFTSAIKQRKGDFELADGGTLFLDEIGDMSLSAQAKVLRALQENKIVRVGGEKEIEVDVRIIAATNKDLRAEIKNNRFREDLYHRLSVIPIHVPALKDRKDDIPILSEHFMKNYCDKEGKNYIEFTKEAFDALQNLEWTGNIRELKNVIERLVILCEGKIEKNDIEMYVKPLN